MNNYIVIGLEGEKYAISVAEVQEIIKPQPITEVPCDKPFVKGVINLRGKIVPVIGLGVRFGLGEAGESRSSRIVIVNTGEEDIGIAVDGVEQATSFEEILPPASGGTPTAGRDFLSGIGRLEGKLISVLDLKAVLGLRREVH